MGRHLALKIKRQEKLEAALGRCRLDRLSQVSGHSSSVLVTQLLLYASHYIFPW